MARLPLSKQLTFAAIVGGVAFVTSMLLAMLTAGVPAQTEHATPSSFIGLIFGAVAGAFYLLLSGNRKVALADDAARAGALAGAEDGMGQILVVREGFAGKLAGVDIMVDGNTAAQLKSPRFTSLSLAPGRHDLMTSVQGKSSDVMSVDLAAGETILVRVIVEIGKLRLARESDIAGARVALKAIPMVFSRGVA